MLYLLDSSVLIDAHRKYYKIDQVFPFWLWLESRAREGILKIPDEMYREITVGKKEDSLRRWLIQRKMQMLLQEEVSVALVQRATATGYAPDLDDEERAKVGNDAFLIAYALAEPSMRCVVTMEESKPSRTRGNRHNPDVCNSLGVRCINTFQMLDELDFLLP